MLTLIVLALLAGIPAASPVKWKFASIPTEKGLVELKMTAVVESGWHIYATTLPNTDGPLPTEFRFKENDRYKVIEPLREPEPVEEFDPNFQTIVRHHSGNPEFTMTIQPIAKGSFAVEGEVEYMVCNDRTCLPPVVVPIKITLEAFK
jgi:thiol:disulfide interchange protein DsbD